MTQVLAKYNLVRCLILLLVGVLAKKIRVVWEQAIDGGWIPSTLLEDIPCTYIDGCVVCEVGLELFWLFKC